MYKYYFVAYFLYFVWQYVRWKLKEKVVTFIHFCFFIRVYTKKLVKVATFFIWVYPSVPSLKRDLADLFNSVCPKKWVTKTILKNYEKIAGNLEISFCTGVHVQTSARVYTVISHPCNFVHIIGTHIE